MMDSALQMQKVAGFESTAYAYVRGEIVWAGDASSGDHPCNAQRPWQPPPFRGDALSLRRGARLCLRLIEESAAKGPDDAKGLLLWLTGQDLPFPLHLATARFDALRAALHADDLKAFESAALRVLGLGPGLTPSGDDFVGGIFFALAHAPRASWRGDLPAVQARMRAAAKTATNVISAALLDDLMAGRSHAALHELLAALQGLQECEIARATQGLLRLGASSGADMLAGLLLTLNTPTPETRT